MVTFMSLCCCIIYLQADFVDWLMSHRPGNRPSAQEVFDSMKWHTLKENAHSDLVPKL